MDTDRSKEEQAPADVPGLVAQARAAYQQNRVRECLALTKAVMLVDPANSAAMEMQSAVRFDMQRDLSDARALIEESRNKPAAQKYRKAAEIILLKILYLDPDSEGAKALLSSVKSASEAPSAPAATPPPSAAAAPLVVVAAPAEPTAALASPKPQTFQAQVLTAPAAATPVAATIAELPEVEPEPMPTASSRLEDHASAYVTRPEYPEHDPIPFTTGATYVEKPGKKKNKPSGMAVPIVIAAIAVLGGGLVLAHQRAGSAVRTADASSLPAPAENVQSPASARPVSYPLSTAAGPLASAVSTASDTAEQTKPALTAVNIPAPNPATAANSRPVPVNTAATGSLAVSSPIAAEIYMGDKYLGSTPTTLQLPAGNQTIEYRHGDLRSMVTHVVKANEITTALVTFDVQVQLNAKPWANVVIEGSPRIPLGQTPLSDVKLPIGTILVFENPNFPSKSHKIDVNDKTIQMVFP